MRPVSAPFATHLASEVNTLAMCWKITRTDETVMGFTAHDSDIIFDGVTYYAATGFTPTDIAAKNDFSVDNLDVMGILDSSAITEEDLMAGIYDYAEVEIFLLNYEDLTQDRMLLRRGWVGEITVSREQFIAEIRGLAQKLSQSIGRVYSPSCDAILGDARCTVDLEDFTESTTVTSVTNRQTFTASALTQDAGYFTGGEVIWTSGANDGRRMEVKEFSNGQVVLALPMPDTITISDGFDIVAGCDKTHTVCKATFDNLINFRGFPHVPGRDKLFETAGTFSSDE